MPTLVIKGKITEGYDHQLKVFDESELMRNSKYGIKCLYRRHEIDDPDTIHVVMFTPSMETIQEHMKNDADLLQKLVVIQVLRRMKQLFVQTKAFPYQVSGSGFDFT